VGSKAGLDRCDTSRPHRDSIHGPSSPKPVAILTELPGPRQLMLCRKIIDACSESRTKNFFFFLLVVVYEVTTETYRVNMVVTNCYFDIKAGDTKTFTCLGSQSHKMK
jgi:hypothetical protein